MMHLLKYKIFYFINKFDRDHILKLNRNINLIFRNYNTNFDLEYYRKIKNFCHSNGFKIYLSNKINVAYKLGFDGVYLSAFNKQFVKNRNFRLNFEILGSAHNLKEIRQKEIQGVNYLFISPIFFKIGKESLGIIKFNNLSKNSYTQIVALGGVNRYNIKKLKLTGVKSFASISFVENFYG